MSLSGQKVELWKLRHAPWPRRLYVHLVGCTFVGGWLRLVYTRSALRRLAPNPARILDAGCGGGSFTLMALRLFPGAEVEAVDFEATERFQGQLAELQSLLAAKKIKNATVRKCDLTRFAEQNKYDLILNIDVLEHIPENKSVLRAFFHALRPGGALALHMPLDKGPLYKNLFPKKTLQELEHEHVGEMYTPEEMRNLLNEIGFRDLEIHGTFHWFGQTAWEWDRILYHRLHGIYPLLFPLIKFCGWLDVRLRLGKPFGMFVLARRPVGKQ